MLILERNKGSQPVVAGGVQSAQFHTLAGGARIRPRDPRHDAHRRSQRLSLGGGCGDDDNESKFVLSPTAGQTAGGRARRFLPGLPGVIRAVGWRGWGALIEVGAVPVESHLNILHLLSSRWGVSGGGLVRNGALKKCSCRRQWRGPVFDHVRIPIPRKTQNTRNEFIGIPPKPRNELINIVESNPLLSVGLVCSVVAEQ